MAAIGCYRRDIHEAVIEKVKLYDAFLGEVAWLSDYKVLNAMRGKCLGLVTQDRDIGDIVRDKYGKMLSSTLPETICGVIGKPVGIGEVRVAGTSHNIGKGWTDNKTDNYFMHNKVLVLGDMEAHSHYILGGEGPVHWVFRPRGFFTGSCNLTYQSRGHIENMVWIECEDSATQQAIGFWENYSSARTIQL